MAIVINDEKGGQKAYEKVVERLDRFRNEMKTVDGYGLIVEVDYPDPVKALEVILTAGIRDEAAVKRFLTMAGVTKVRGKARIVHPDGRILASGEAEKDRDDNGFTEATSEWVQTKAIGRCLAAAAYGTGEISTADEILQELVRKGQLKTEKPKSTPTSKKESQSKAQPQAEQPAKHNPPDQAKKPAQSGVSVTAEPKAVEILKQMGIDLAQLRKDGLAITFDEKSKEVVVGGESKVVMSLKSYLGAQLKWKFTKGEWRKKAE